MSKSSARWPSLTTTTTRTPTTSPTSLKTATTSWSSTATPPSLRTERWRTGKKSWWRSWQRRMQRSRSSSSTWLSNCILERESHTIVQDPEWSSWNMQSCHIWCTRDILRWTKQKRKSKKKKLITSNVSHVQNTMSKISTIVNIYYKKKMHEYPHFVHLCGFSPEWTFLCVCRLLDCVVLYSHWLQL